MADLPVTPRERRAHPAPPGAETDAPDGDLSARDAGEALLRVAAQLDAMFEQATAGEGVSPVEARLLGSIRVPLSQRELALQMGCDVTRVSVLTGGLEARDLLSRVRDAGDRRIRRATLTPRGRSVVDRIGARLLEISPLVHRLDADERHLLLGLLAKLEGGPRQEG